MQLRLIFKPVFGDRTSGPPLAYVQYFSPVPGSVHTQVDSQEVEDLEGNSQPVAVSLASSGQRAHLATGSHQMYEVVRSLRGDQTRKGEIIELTEIWRPVQLIPKFGLMCPPEWTCDTAVEEAKSFFVNCFLDKETYQSVY